MKTFNTASLLTFGLFLESSMAQRGGGGFGGGIGIEFGNEGPGDHNHGFNISPIGRCGGRFEYTCVGSGFGNCCSQFGCKYNTTGLITQTSANVTISKQGG